MLENSGGASDVATLAVETNKVLEGDSVGDNLSLLHLLKEVTGCHIVPILEVNFQNGIVVGGVEGQPFNLEDAGWVIFRLSSEECTLRNVERVSVRSFVLSSGERSTRTEPQHRRIRSA